ncbi:hypothetical protein ACOJUR_05070 [Alicyclobacillus tolerans]|uniref:hypothetical protein n=1 Tax=Alicyclobacillus tolerans TaxID=90970 RepID=UPI003B7C254E
MYLLGSDESIQEATQSPFYTVEGHSRFFVLQNDQTPEQLAQEVLQAYQLLYNPTAMVAFHYEPMWGSAVRVDVLYLVPKILPER